MDVRCRRENCKNNKGQTCTLKGFVVGENQNCQNFELDKSKEDKLTDVSKNMFVKNEHFSPFKNIKKFDLKCDCTKCIFNCQKKCKSNGITLLAQNEKDAKCLNYFPE